MKFSDLENAHNEYLKKENTETFNNYRERSCWNFEDFNEDSVEKDILGFLNKWGIYRIPYVRKIELFPTLKNLKDDIQHFNNKNLWEDFDLKDKKQD